MIVGTVRPEEARVFDQEAGYHSFTTDDGVPYGSFEVFWSTAYFDSSDLREGWYWWPCYPGCTPDAEEPNGPFASSTRARADADEHWQ